MMPTIIPSTDIWDRREFLNARKAQLQSMRPIDPYPLKGIHVHVLDVGDQILCDACDMDINTPTVRLVEYGRKVMCAACFMRWHAGTPVTYRRLNQDGTLGEVVPNGGGNE
jgi:hypothetical protein